ncbi:MAG TPA: hypothetical protein VG797_05175 [Phycisphaerales bacterium]|nr:hypothetical protein [Phycisphaerales bacterium]
MKRLSIVVCAMLVAAGSATGVYAAGTQTKSKSGGDQNQQPLGGPKVKDNDAPGNRPSFGDGVAAGKDGKRGPGIPFEAFLTSVRSLSADGAPENVRLTAEQQEKLQAIVSEFQSEMREFRAQHESELKELREKAGLPEGAGGAGARRPGAKGGKDAGSENNTGADQKPALDDRAGKPRAGTKGAKGKPGASGQEVTPEQAAAREKLRELRAQGPKPDVLRSKAWSVLNSDQQAYVQGKLNEMRMRGGPGAEGAGAGGAGAPTTDATNTNSGKTGAKSFSNNKGRGGKSKP